MTAKRDVGDRKMEAVAPAIEDIVDKLRKKKNIAFKSQKSIQNSNLFNNTFHSIDQKHKEAYHDKWIKSSLEKWIKPVWKETETETVSERHRKEEKRQNRQTTYGPWRRRKKVKIGNYKMITIARQAEGWVKWEIKWSWPGIVDGETRTRKASRK